VRRFGTWRCVATPDWPIDRGPDPVSEHDAFRCGVAAAVAAHPNQFENKPICQVMHDQSLFNGIGNYLRAEILLRAGVAPFANAKDVLAKCPAISTKLPNDKQDLLTLCRDVPKEVIRLKLSKYQGGNAAAATDTDVEHTKFRQWLRVYSHDDSSWAVDKEGRRIWFRGNAGELFAKFAQKSSLTLAGSSLKKKPSMAVGKKSKPSAVMKAAVSRKMRKHILKKPASVKTTRK